MIQVQVQARPGRDDRTMAQATPIVHDDLRWKGSPPMPVFAPTSTRGLYRADRTSRIFVFRNSLRNSAASRERCCSSLFLSLRRSRSRVIRCVAGNDTTGGAGGKGEAKGRGSLSRRFSPEALSRSWERPRNGGREEAASMRMPACTTSSILINLLIICQVPRISSVPD